MIESIYHVSFTVSNIDRSIEFYKQLGFHISSDRRFLKLPYLRAAIDYPDADMHLAILEGYNVALELIEYVQPKGVDLDKSNRNVGSAHIAFFVDDIKEEYDRLLQLNVVFRTPPVMIDSGPNQGKHFVYFYDPDGYTLEFVESRKNGE